MQATARQLRMRARQLGEDIADMIATAVAIGEEDDWTGERYEAIERDLAKWRHEHSALIARAVALETAAA